MNITTVIIGVAAILFGIYTLYLRIQSPEKLGKLNAADTENRPEARLSVTGDLQPCFL